MSNPRRKKWRHGKVQATPVTREMPLEGGAKGMGEANAQKMGTSSQGEVIFAHPVKTTSK